MESFECDDFRYKEIDRYSKKKGKQLLTKPKKAFIIVMGIITIVLSFVLIKTVLEIKYMENEYNAVKRKIDSAEILKGNTERDLVRIENENREVTVKIDEIEGFIKKLGKEISTVNDKIYDFTNKDY